MLEHLLAQVLVDSLLAVEPISVRLNTDRANINNISPLTSNNDEFYKTINSYYERFTKNIFDTNHNLTMKNKFVKVENIMLLIKLFMFDFDFSAL